MRRWDKSGLRKAQIVGKKITYSPNAVYFNSKTKTLLFDTSNKHVPFYKKNTLYPVNPISLASNAIYYVKFEYPVPEIWPIY